MDEETSIGSVGDLTGDESPRLSMEEQKLFNDQFYSLVKVDSIRSLLSNCSRDQQSFNSLTELLNNKSFDSLVLGSEKDAGGQGGESAATRKSFVEDIVDESALREFDEISRQISQLSQTVDALNLSMNSLNSEDGSPGERNPPPTTCPPQAGHKVNKEVDEYHWLDDEFFLASCNGQTSVLPGGEQFLEPTLAQEEVKLRRSSDAQASSGSRQTSLNKRDTWPLGDTDDLHKGERSSFIFCPDNKHSGSLSPTDVPEHHVSAPDLTDIARQDIRSSLTQPGCTVDVTGSLAVGGTWDQHCKVGECV